MSATVPRAGVAALVLLLLLVGQGDALVRASVPAIRAAVPLLASELRVLALDMGPAGGDRALRMEVTLAHTVVIGERVLVPDSQGRAQAATPALQGLQAPLLALWAVTSLGSMHWRKRALAMLLVLPAAALLAVAGPALALSAAVWNMLHQTLAPQSASFLLELQAWSDRGGRLLLALASAGLALGAAGLISPTGPRPVR